MKCTCMDDIWEETNDNGQPLKQISWPLPDLRLAYHSQEAATPVCFPILYHPLVLQAANEAFTQVDCPIWQRAYHRQQQRWQDRLQRWHEYRPYEPRSALHAQGEIFSPGWEIMRQTEMFMHSEYSLHDPIAEPDTQQHGLTFFCWKYIMDYHWNAPSWVDLTDDETEQITELYPTVFGAAIAAVRELTIAPADTMQPLSYSLHRQR